MMIMNDKKYDFCEEKTIDDIVNHGVGKCLDQFDIEHSLYPRWGTF